MRNIVILVADSLRYDSVPDSIAGDSASAVIPTLAPSLHTPTSFASLFTGLEAQNHTVRRFIEDLDPGTETAFDRVPNASFWDGPDSALNKHVFKSSLQDLDEMEEPFLWIERVMDTHLPYGKLGHQQDYDFDEGGWEYIERLKGEDRVREAYQEGLDAFAEHFRHHLDELEDRGILDDTLVVVTSDHGELLGERFLWRERYEHNYPPLRPLVEVPTVFYNAEVDAEAMRLVDVVPTALGITGRDGTLGDGVDVREKEVTRGTNIMEDVKARFDTTWRFRGEHWAPTPASRLQIVAKTLLGDLKRFSYRRGYKPLEEKLAERREERKKEQDELAGVEI